MRQLLVTVWILGILLISKVYGAADSDANTTLEFAQIIFRHGARNPDKTYPTDPYRNESYWPEGWSQLTKIGVEQEYDLGCYLRERYSSFVNEKYQPKEIYVLSSDVDRTIMSADALMAGFYIPNKKVENSSNGEGIPWKSVPLHTIPKDYDNVIRQEAPCPRYQQISDEFKANSELLESFREENKELFEYFRLHTGLNITNPSDFSKFYDTLVIENYLNYTLPEWAQPVVNKGNSTFLGNFYFEMLTYTSEMKTLRAGPLLAKIKENFDLKISGKSNSKIFFYSGHDHTITTVMDSLGVFNKRRPPFSSCLMLELHRSKTENTYEIKIYYRNETNREPYEIFLPTCAGNGNEEGSCDYFSFLKLLEPYIPVDWNSKCQLKYDTVLGGYGGWIVLILLTIMLVCIIRALFSKSGCTCWNSSATDYNSI